MVDEEVEEVEVKEFGEYIVADPGIGHGQLTFRGTRILVTVVLEQVASGTDWADITRSWRGKVPHQAITDAVTLARNALASTHDEYRLAAAG